MYTLDTNAIIYYLQKQPAVDTVIRSVLEQRLPVFVSTMTEIELYSFPQLSPAEAKSIEDTLATVTVLPINSAFARQAGQLRRVYGLKLADSAIAATSLMTGSTLITRNIKDFRKIPNLRLQKI